MDFMFFRNKSPKVPGFGERLDNLKNAGFTVKALGGGASLVSRDGCAVALGESEGEIRGSQRAGVLMGDEIGVLVDGGFQKFFRAPSGAQKPALARELKALHDFEEDLKEGLGQESYYNQSLGTVSTLYLYDRLKDRDRGVSKRVWED